MKRGGGPRLARLEAGVPDVVPPGVVGGVVHAGVLLGVLAAGHGPGARGAGGGRQGRASGAMAGAGDPARCAAQPHHTPAQVSMHPQGHTTLPSLILDQLCVAGRAVYDSVSFYTSVDNTDMTISHLISQAGWNGCNLSIYLLFSSISLRAGVRAFVPLPS